MTITMFVFGLASGSLSARFGAKAVLIAGSTITIVPFLMMAFAHSALWQVAVAMGLLGVGFGLAFSAMSNIIVDAVPTTQTGVASGMNANIRTIGGCLGAAVVASVITSTTQADGYPKESGYTAGFGLLALALALAALCGLLIPNLHVERDAHQREQAAMSHPELALVPAGTIVGDESE